jgi:hypothetical protein
MKESESVTDEDLLDDCSTGRARGAAGDQFEISSRNG